MTDSRSAAEIVDEIDAILDDPYGALGIGVIEPSEWHEVSIAWGTDGNVDIELDGDAVDSVVFLDGIEDDDTNFAIDNMTDDKLLFCTSCESTVTVIEDDYASCECGDITHWVNHDTRDRENQR